MFAIILDYVPSTSLQFNKISRQIELLKKFHRCVLQKIPRGSFGFVFFKQVPVG